MRRVLIALLLAAVNGGCTTKAGGQQAGKVLASSASAAASAFSAQNAEQPQRALPLQAFQAAMRALDYQTARKHFGQLDAQQRKRPELRYARAYLSAKLNDHAVVLEATKELAAALPSLKDEIERLRANAQLHAGDPLLAEQFFAKQKAPHDLLLAARASHKANNLKLARKHVDLALALAAKTKRPDHELLAELRRARIEIASSNADEKPSSLVILDLRWLALDAPTTTAARGADEELEKVKGQLLTKAQRYERALAFAEEGRLEETRAELEALKKAPGPPIKAGELLHAEARAHYSRRDYENAATLFDAAVKGGTQHRLKDTFYAARSLSRADRDREAIKRYQQFIQAFPGTRLTEDAYYLTGRLYYIMGEWQQAAVAYNKYLTKFSKRGRFLKTARYELAVTRLAQRDFDKALTGLGRLVERESDPRLKSRYRLLEAIALAGSGNKAKAATKLKTVISEVPLSFAALAAAARLQELGEKVPAGMPAAETAEAPPSLKLELPKKVRFLSEIGLDDLAGAELISHESALKQQYHPRELESLCQAYAGFSGAARRYQVGQRAAGWTLLTKPPNPQTRWLWECVYPRPYSDSVAQAEREFKLPAHLVYAVMRQESTFKPRIVSSAKAVGLMQMIAPTAKRVMEALKLKYDPTLLKVPRHNIRFGGYYLRRLLDTFGQNFVLATASYNAGPKAVSQWLKGGEQLELDVFVARIPYRETRNYVERVVENLARYAYLEGGNSAVPQLDLTLPKGLRADETAY
jgi:soluble lytic murein transglycosylase